MGFSSIDPRDKAPHSPLVLGMLGELLPQPSAPRVELWRLKTARAPGLDPVLNEAAVCRRLGKRCEISPQSNHSGNAAKRAEEKEHQPEQAKRKPMPGSSVSNSEAEHRQKENALKKHPEPAAPLKADHSGGIILYGPQQGA